MTQNDLKERKMSVCVSNKSFGVIWDHLESFKSWGDKISYTTKVQRMLKNALSFVPVQSDKVTSNSVGYLEWHSLGFTAQSAD